MNRYAEVGGGRGAPKNFELFTRCKQPA